MPQGPKKEGRTFLTWVYDDGVDKGEMIDEGVGIRTDRTAVARYAVGSGTDRWKQKSRIRRCICRTVWCRTSSGQGKICGRFGSKQPYDRRKE